MTAKPPVQERARAPKLQAFLERRYGPTVIVTPLVDWNALDVGSTQLVQIVADRTPIADVAHAAARVAIVANQVGPSNARVSVYRYDPADAPKDWNTDHYSVLLNLERHANIHDLVNSASTSYDMNLQQFLRENVFWVKEDRGDDHWLRYDELPSVVQAIIDIRSTST
jgi:hypothetical protein